MAVQSLDTALKLHGPPIYVFHEIVHNQTVVKRFVQRGAVFVNSLDQVPDHSLVLFSAHGVSPDIEKQAFHRNLKTIDATCPLVTKVHIEALRFAKGGMRIFLIGHKGHDEVTGTFGQAPHAIEVMENVEDIENLNVDPDAKVAYLTQTTLSFDDTKKIVERLRAKFPHIVGPSKNDICYATQNRQQAVKALATRADLVIVIGSQNSSNSLRLAEIARQCGKTAVLIDRVEDIQPAWMEGKNCILVTAGAAPLKTWWKPASSTCRKPIGLRWKWKLCARKIWNFGCPGNSADRRVKSVRRPSIVPKINILEN